MALTLRRTVADGEPLVAHCNGGPADGQKFAVPPEVTTFCVIVRGPLGWSWTDALGHPCLEVPMFAVVYEAVKDEFYELVPYDLESVEFVPVRVERQQ